MKVLLVKLYILVLLFTTDRSGMLKLENLLVLIGGVMFCP